MDDDAALAEGELSAALDGWVAAFDREMEQTGDFAMSVGAMTAHGCFDVRTVVERWIVANPIDDVIFMKGRPEDQEVAPLRPSPRPRRRRRSRSRPHRRSRRGRSSGRPRGYSPRS